MIAVMAYFKKILLFMVYENKEIIEILPSMPSSIILIFYDVSVPSTDVI
jgi:hypothetical protein